MKKYDYVTNILADMVRCIVIGLIAAAVMGVCGAVLGKFLYEASQVPMPALQGSVSALLITGSISMLLSAFFLAARRKETKKVSERWENVFRCFGYSAAFLTVSITMLLAG